MSRLGRESYYPKSLCNSVRMPRRETGFSSFQFPI